MAVEKDKQADASGAAKLPDSNGVLSKEAKRRKKEQEAKDAELSEEDLELKQNLEMMLERIKDSDSGVQSNALQSISEEIRSATTSMTSVPKPLKFLRKHYDSVKSYYESMPESDNKPKLADVLSILAISSAAKDSRESLKFRLAGSKSEVGSWGNEYVRNLAAEIAAEFSVRRDAEENADELLSLVAQIVPYHMSHNAEPEAVDILLEVDRLGWLEQYVDAQNYARTCLYLASCCSYLPEADDRAVLHAAFSIYMKVKAWPDALRIALRLDSREKVEAVLGECGKDSGPDSLQERQQLAYILASQGFWVDFEADGPAQVAMRFENDEERAKQLAEVTEICGNTRLSQHYLSLARDLDVMEAKLPEEVYKAHLVEGRAPAGPAVDSARANLAATFVNAFVNAGFGADKLLTPEAASEDGDHLNWVFKNKDHGKAAAVASLGLITLWDVQGGLPLLDKYFYAQDPYLVAGGCLGMGIVSARTQTEHDPAYALLYEYVEKENPTTRIGAIFGLGLAYAGKRREDVGELLSPLLSDPAVSMEVAAFAALALGLVFVGSCHEDSINALLQALMTRSSEELSQSWAKPMCLGLALLFLGKQDATEATLEVAKTLDEHISQYCQVVLETCAYAGTGDVLKVQQMLATAGEHLGTEDDTAWKAAHQGPAVLGLAMISMGEELGATMSLRMLEHLLRYGEPAVRQAVPLAIGLLFVSNPDVQALDALSRLSHDANLDVAQNAVLALGIAGAGTNNARLAGMLRQLGSYYYKDPTLLLLVRVAQGLVHLGKGLLTLAPAHADNQLLSGVALAGLLVVLHASMDMKTTLAGKHPWLLYTLAPAMRPRMLLTLDTQGQLLSCPVRVGQAVDVVAQAGRPKTITGFQTHETPVLLNVGERAELATSKYIALSSVLEGIVILKPNPDYVDTGP